MDQWGGKMAGMWQYWQKEHVLITVTHKQKISVNAAMAGKTPKDFQYNSG